jgi:RNA polymerase sigma factor (sigma-70 family)
MPHVKKPSLRSIAERNALVEKNIGLVGRTLNNLFGRRQHFLSVPQEDLMQEGAIGLMRACETFQEGRISPKTGRPVRFSTYATWWIRESILKCMSQRGGTIHVPQHVHNLVNRNKRGEQLTKRQVELADAAQRCDFWHAGLPIMRDEQGNEDSRDVPDDMRLFDHKAPDRQAAYLGAMPIAALFAFTPRPEFEELHAALKQLPPDELTLLRDVFWFRRSMKALGEEACPPVTREAVRQQVMRICEKLGKLMPRNATESR